MCMQLLHESSQRSQEVQREECSKDILHPRTIRWTYPEPHHALPLEIPPERPTNAVNIKAMFIRCSAGLSVRFCHPCCADLSVAADSAGLSTSSFGISRRRSTGIRGLLEHCRRRGWRTLHPLLTTQRGQVLRL